MRSLDSLLPGLLQQLTPTKTPPAPAPTPTSDEHANDILPGFQIWCPQVQKAYDETLRFCQQLRTRSVPPYWLTLYGPSGNGKTMLARLTWRWFMRAARFYVGRAEATLAHDGHYCSWPRFLQECRGGDYSRRDDLQSVWLCIIDDIGAEGNTALSRDLLFQCLNARVGKWTMLTSNLSPQELADTVDARIASRIIRDHNTVVANHADDYALRKFAGDRQ